MAGSLGLPSLGSRVPSGDGAGEHRRGSRCQWSHQGPMGTPAPRWMLSALQPLPVFSGIPHPLSADTATRASACYCARVVKIRLSGPALPSEQRWSSSGLPSAPGPLGELCGAGGLDFMELKVVQPRPREAQALPPQELEGSVSGLSGHRWGVLHQAEDGGGS